MSTSGRAMATAPPVWVVGAGGQARETLDLLAVAYAGEARGLLDESAEEEFLAAVRIGIEHGTVVLGLGFPAVRARALARFLDAGVRLPTVVHPRADVGSGTRLGQGVVVAAGCVVTTDVQIGDGVLLNPRSGVGHDTTLGTCCVVNPGATLSGSVRFGDRVLVGSGATVLQGLSVGDDAVIGAGAVVTRDVPAGATVVGVPARIVEPSR